MNDEELNALISRNDGEITKYREMDIQRERDAQDNWTMQGGRGKPPPPLMQLEELPECYRNDEPFITEDVDEGTEGRGQRRRNIVSYTDGLNDDEWAMVR